MKKFSFEYLIREWKGFHLGVLASIVVSMFLNYYNSLKLEYSILGSIIIVLLYLVVVLFFQKKQLTASKLNSNSKISKEEIETLVNIKKLGIGKIFTEKNCILRNIKV